MGQKIPTRKIKDVAAEARRRAFSTDDTHVEDRPQLLSDYRLELNKWRNEEEKSTQDELAKSEKEINSWETIKDPANIKNKLESKVHSYMNFNVNSYKAKISSLHQDFINRKDNLTNFRNEHNRTFLPIRADKGYIPLVIVAVLFLIEVIANERLFEVVTGSVTQQQRLIAWTLSLSQSFINVISGFIVGKYFIGRILLLDWKQKILPLIGFLSHVAAVVWINFSIGLWRAILTNNSSAEEQTPLMFALYPFQNLKLFQGDITSVLVVGVGLVFLLIAYVDGYFSDDPYPAYGDRYREVEKAKLRGMDMIGECKKKWNDAIKDYKETLNDFNDRAFKELDKWNKTVNHIQKILVDWENNISTCDNHFKDVKEAYQASFNRAVKESSKKINLDKEILWDKKTVDPHQVFRDATHHFMTDGERIKEFDKLKAEYRVNFNKETQYLDDHNKKITAEINALSDQYEFK